jgi:hypothetical protein
VTLCDFIPHAPPDKKHWKALNRFIVRCCHGFRCANESDDEMCLKILAEATACALELQKQYPWKSVVTLQLHGLRKAIDARRDAQ